MSGIDEDQLFVALQPEEEVNVVGGFFILPVQQFIIDQVMGAFRQGVDKVRQVVQTFDWFFRLPGNGVIFGDRKGSTTDLFRHGNVPVDSPYTLGGVRISNKWIAGL